MDPFNTDVIKTDVDDGYYASLLHPDFANINAYMVSKNQVQLKDN